MSQNNSPDKKRKRDEDPEHQLVEEKTAKRQKLDDGKAQTKDNNQDSKKQVVKDDDSEDFDPEGSDDDSFDDDFDNSEDLGQSDDKDFDVEKYKKWREENPSESGNGFEFGSEGLEDEEGLESDVEGSESD